MITENLSALKIHKLTQKQYNRELESGNLEDNALYLTLDDSTSIDDAIRSHNSSTDAHSEIRQLIPTVTSLITSGSTDVVTSGAVYTALASLIERIELLEAQPNTTE